MDQIRNLLYFLPLMISLFWFINYCLRVKSVTQKMMTVIQGLCIYYFFTFALYISPWTDYRLMVTFDIFNVPVSLSLLAFDLVWVATHHSRRFLESRSHYLIYTPIIVSTSINFLLYYGIGIDAVARFVEASDKVNGFPMEYDHPLYRLYYMNLTTLRTIISLAYIVGICFLSITLSKKKDDHWGDVYQFLFRGKASQATRIIGFLNMTALLIMVPFAYLGRSWMFNHPVHGATISVLMAIVMNILFYVEYMIEGDTVTLKSLARAHMQGQQTDITKPEVPAPPVQVATVETQTKEINPVLEKAIRKAFDEDQIYKDPQLTIQKMAEHVSSNRTTVAEAISILYNKNFRQVVALYRIEAAKRYMKENPEVIQEIVANDCGFITAQAFNQKFKEVVGESPRMWLTKNATK